MEKSHVGLYQCFFCGEDIGIILDRKLRNSLPMKAGIIDMDPCDSCKEWMKQGIILISIADDTTAEDMGKGKGKMPNPYRTGGWVVLKDEAFKKIDITDKSFIDFGLKHRFMFLTDQVWDLLGLPKTASQDKEVKE